MRPARSDPDFRHVHIPSREHQAHSQLIVKENARLRSVSEANLLHAAKAMRRHSIAPLDPGYTHGAIGFDNFYSPPRPLSCAQHPHLQLREVEAIGSSRKAPVLRGVSFEAGATDLLAVMATTEKEGTLVLKVIAGRKRIKKGDIILNGRPVTAKTLR